MRLTYCDSCRQRHDLCRCTVVPAPRPARERVARSRGATGRGNGRRWRVGAWAAAAVLAVGLGSLWSGRSRPRPSAPPRRPGAPAAPTLTPEQYATQRAALWALRARVAALREAQRADDGPGQWAAHDAEWQALLAAPDWAAPALAGCDGALALRREVVLARALAADRFRTGGGEAIARALARAQACTAAGRLAAALAALDGVAPAYHRLAAFAAVRTFRAQLAADLKAVMDAEAAVGEWVDVVAGVGDADRLRLLGGDTGAAVVGRADDAAVAVRAGVQPVGVAFAPPHAEGWTDYEIALTYRTDRGCRVAVRVQPDPDTGRPRGTVWAATAAGSAQYTTALLHVEGDALTVTVDGQPVARGRAATGVGYPLLLLPAGGTLCVRRLRYRRLAESAGGGPAGG